MAASLIVQPCSRNDSCARARSSNLIFALSSPTARAMDTNLLTHRFYFQLGAADERARNYEEAEKYFRRCLELQPDFSEAMNYLGYMWAERGLNLVEARQLIEKAVATNDLCPVDHDEVRFDLRDSVDRDRTPLNRTAHLVEQQGSQHMNRSLTELQIRLRLFGQGARTSERHQT